MQAFQKILPLDEQLGCLSSFYISAPTGKSSSVLCAEDSMPNTNRLSVCDNATSCIRETF